MTKLQRWRYIKPDGNWVIAYEFMRDIESIPGEGAFERLYEGKHPLRSCEMKARLETGETEI